MGIWIFNWYIIYGVDKMKTRYEVLEERRKLMKWLGNCDEIKHKRFVERIEILDWVLEDSQSLNKANGGKK